MMFQKTAKPRSKEMSAIIVFGGSADQSGNRLGGGTITDGHSDPLKGIKRIGRQEALSLRLISLLHVNNGKDRGMQEKIVI